MKRIFALLLTVVLAACVGAEEKKPLRVLIVGNSFSVSVMRELPNIVDAQKEHALDITSLYIGGCTLERHVREYEKAVKDPKHRPYSQTHYITGQGRLPRVMGNLVDALAAGKYDVITIQQASPKSFDLKSWEPWGDRLVAIIREKQPQAKLMIQQTWSYRLGTPKMAEWGFDQRGMFEQVKKVCADRAAHFGAKIIPMGEAVQIYRSRTVPTKLNKLPKEKLAKYTRPRRPPYRGDVVGSYRWVNNRKLKKVVMTYDNTHLNPLGEYLQGCVWFGSLFGADVTKITYQPKYLKPGEGELLRQCAADAVVGKCE